MKGLQDLSRDLLDHARLNRDARFDGRFFFAMMASGTYCRPICPIPASKQDQVHYYESAAEAAEDGFQPCPCCRPEAAPASPPWLVSSAVVRRALRLIQNGVLDQESIEDFGRRFGISSRHLGRLFSHHIGASPTMVAQTRRLNFARRLLGETRLPIAAVASASGFASVRRFNDAFLTTYRVPPSKLRPRSGALGVDGGATQVRLKLAYRPPYDWAHLHGFLSKRAISGLEAVDDAEYVRVLHAPSGHALIRVRCANDADALDLTIEGAQPSDLMPLVASVQRMFDLQADPARIADALSTDPLLRPLIKRQPGLRIAGSADPFECCVRALLGKGLKDAGRSLLGQLVARLGQRIDTSCRWVTHLFPNSNIIADANLAEFEMSDRRRRALRLMACGVQDGSIKFDAPSEEVERMLSNIVGKWVAGYVALRGLGEADAFPYGDLIVRRGASSRDFPLSSQELSRRAARWRPFRGYATFHLWSDRALRLAAGAK